MILLFSIIGCHSFGQVTSIYYQDFGTGTTLPTGWSTSGTSTWSKSASNSSTPTPTFSGGSNLLSGSSSNARTVTYSNNLSTIGYSNITVLWAGRRTYTKTISFEWSADGLTWNPVVLTDVAANSTWAWVNAGTRIVLPAGAAGIASLGFRWTYDSDGNSGAYRLDDFTVEGCMFPSQPSPITGNSSPCVGSSIIYSVTNVAGVTYSWSFPAGWIQTAGGNSNTVTVTVGAASGTVSVIPSNVCGSGTSQTLSVTVINAVPSQPSTITGNSNPCLNSSQTYSVVNVPGVSYSWSFPAGWVQTGGGTSNSVTVAVGANPGSIIVTPSNSCGNGTARSLAVTISPLPVPTISGTSTYCEGSTSCVYSTESGMTNYVWSVSAGGTITSGGTGSNTATVTWLTAGTQSISVSYTNANGCIAASPTSKTVFINALPVPTIAGPAAVCVGAAGNTYTTEAGMTNYLWSVSAGGTVTSGGTSASNSITITWNNAGPQTVSVNYTDPTGCSGASPTIKPVSVNSFPVPTITGSSPVCVGSTGNVYFTEAGKSNYLWTVSAGGTITAGGTVSSSSITITWTTTGLQTVSVSYTDEIGCPASSPTTKTVIVNDPTLPVISGPSSVCQGSTGNVYTTQAGMTAYSWSVSAGGTITAGGNGNNYVTITWTTTGAKTVSVSYTDGSGCASPSPAVYPVTVYALPLPVVSGPNSVCSGTSGNVYSTASGMSSYSWTVSAGGTITSGGNSGSNSVTVTWNTAGSQSVSVSYTDANGCVPASPTVYAVTVKLTPNISALPLSQTKVCPGSNITPIVITNPNGIPGTTFGWTRDNTAVLTGIAASGTGSPITGALSSTTPQTPQTTIFTITATGNGCSSTILVPVTVYDDEPPVINNMPSNVSIECQQCIQAFVNADFEGNPSIACWSYVANGGVPGWQSTTGTIEIQKSKCVDGVASYSGNYHAELNSNLVGDLYQQFCTVPTTTVQVSFAHHKRMSSNNTTDDIMAVFTGPNLGSLTKIYTATATNTSGWKIHTVSVPIPYGQTTTIFLFRAIQGAPTDPTYGNLIDDIHAVTLFNPTLIPSATDNCPGVGLSLEEQNIPGGCFGHYQLQRKWTATDGAGNITIATQLVTVGDFTSPVLQGVPANVTIDCSSSIPVPPTVTATDNCSASANIIISYTQTVTPGTCAYSYSITRRWTAKDECNNTSVGTQVITVTDATAPILSAAPSNITVSCNAIPAPVVLTATDNCDPSPIVTYSESISNGSCANNYSILRTWRATDICGNFSTATQTIIVQDISPPSITCPGPLSVQCMTQVPLPDIASVSATDNCTGSILISFVSDVPSGSNPMTVTRTYRATDICGNSATCTQLITVQDNTLPTIICPSNITVPADLGQNYASNVSLGTPIYNDNCSVSSLVWVLTGATTGLSGPGINILTSYTFNVGVTVITYTVSDPVGNSATCSFTVTVTPNTPPSITCQPNIVLNTESGVCTASVDPGIPSINAGSGIVFTWVMTGATSGSGTGPITPSPYPFNLGVTTVNWTATNISGTASCSQTITVVDNQPPDFVPPLPQVYCVINIIDATYFDPTMDIAPARPEYYILSPADKASLSPDPASFTDNCTPVGSLVLSWRIDFNGGSPAPITGTGLLSSFAAEIRLPGAISSDVIHTITYWLQDSAGNVSASKTVNITIKPRPYIIKQ